MSLHPAQDNTHPMATGMKSYGAWRCLQIKQQAEERYDRWVKAGRPRPKAAGPVPDKIHNRNKWVADKPITMPNAEYGMKGLRGS